MSLFNYFSICETYCTLSNFFHNIPPLFNYIELFSCGTPFLCIGAELCSLHRTGTIAQRKDDDQGIVLQ